MYILKQISKILLVIFAIIGILFTGVYIAMQLGLTNVRGTIKERNESLLKNLVKLKNTSSTENKILISCKVHVLAKYAPDTAKNTETAYETTRNVDLVEKMFENAVIRFSDTNIISEFNTCTKATKLDATPIAQTAYAWADSAEWKVLKSAFIRDQDTINKAAKDAGVSPRILLGGVIGEQMRFFGNSRESFKAYFEPLKILATLSKFSYGIAGLKPETVARIDENLKNKDSVFYLGPKMENIITYDAGADPDTVRFERITDTKNTYYSYLYVGLFMREVTAQWHAAGYEIGDKPGVLSTLYNLGFNRSIPKADAAPGGAVITINGKEYSFGELGEQFYYSGELIQEFPYSVK